VKRAASFEAAAEGIDKTGASVDERRIVSMLAEHAASEEALLERYRRFVTGAASPAARYLVRLIVDDEERHHRLLAEMANAVAWESSDSSPTETVPDLYPERDGALAEETKALLATEVEDRHQLRRLHRQLAPYQETTLWELLVQLMELDTEKHVHILRFLARHSG
jgi:rubrerythrin